MREPGVHVTTLEGHTEVGSAPLIHFQKHTLKLVR